MGAHPGAARPLPQPSEPAPAIVARGLVRRFGGVRALEGVDIEAGAGSLVVVLGPNGAGKSTLLGILAGLTRPDAGRVLVAGQDLNRAPAAARLEVGLVSHQPLVYPELTAEENLRFHAKLYGLPADAEALRPALEAADLWRQRHRRVRDFSRGMRQRLAIARAIYRDAPILMLDEATSALDTEAERMVQAALDNLMRNRTTLVIAHRLSTIEQADRIVVMQQGRIVEVGSHSELLAKGGIYAAMHAVQFSEAE